MQTSLITVSLVLGRCLSGHQPLPFLNLALKDTPQVVARILILHLDLVDDFAQGNAPLHQLIRRQQIRCRVSHVVTVLKLLGKARLLIEVRELVLVVQGLLIVETLLLGCTIQSIEVAKLVHRKILCVARGVLGLCILKRCFVWRFRQGDLILRLNRFYRLWNHFWLLGILNKSLGFLILASLGLSIQKINMRLGALLPVIDWVFLNSAPCTGLLNIFDHLSVLLNSLPQLHFVVLPILGPIVLLMLVLQTLP